MANDVLSLANDEIYSIISTGPRLYGGERMRAILSYGETGDPYIIVEKLKLVYGSYPSESKILWRKSVNLAGDKEEAIFPPSEFWKGELANIQWRKSQLIYQINIEGKEYHCSASVSESAEVIVSTCNEKN